MSPVVDTSSALTHFKQIDPIMAELLSRALEREESLQIPSTKHPAEYFTSIVSSIVSQQISVAAAAAVLGRLHKTTGGLTPDNVTATSEDALRAAGLSQQKVKYLKHNAAIWPTVPVHSFSSLPDEEVIKELTKLYGVGRWTAEMFLMFSLARPDVFSYGDLGLMNGLLEQYPGIKKHHVRKIRTLVDSWSPHRTTAALTLWFHKDNGPVLL